MVERLFSSLENRFRNRHIVVLISLVRSSAVLWAIVMEARIGCILVSTYFLAIQLLLHNGSRLSPNLGPMALATEEIGQEVTGADCWNGSRPRRPYRAVSLICWRQGRKSRGRGNMSEETWNGIRRLFSNE
jgi:hypothetical protein